MAFRIFSLLLQTENDIRFFIRETQGLRILTDALFSAFEASQHVSIFHTGSASTVAGGNAQTPVTVRGEIVGLLTKVLNTYRTAEDEVTEVSAPTSSQSTRTGTSSEGRLNNRYFFCNGEVFRTDFDKTQLYDANRLTPVLYNLSMLYTALYFFFTFVVVWSFIDCSQTNFVAIILALRFLLLEEEF